MTRRKYTLERFQVLNDFVDHGLAELSRSEIAVYMTLFRDTRPTGLARTSLTELSRRGGDRFRRSEPMAIALVPSRRDQVRLTPARLG